MEGASVEKDGMGVVLRRRRRESINMSMDPLRLQEAPALAGVERPCSGLLSSRKGWGGGGGRGGPPPGHELSRVNRQAAQPSFAPRNPWRIS